jgi:hypothetical protein
MKLLLTDGPFKGITLELPTASATIWLGIDDHGNPDTTSPPKGMAFYRQIEVAGDVAIYTLLSFQRSNGLPYEIHFADGPAKGVLPANRPVLCLDSVERIAIIDDETRYSGTGEIAAEAIYERRQVGESWQYFFVKFDRDAERVANLVKAENDRKLAAAMRTFYETPDYSIYSKPPTDNHPQKLVEVGHRRGHVDENIAPLIEGLWKLNLDTIGSCEQLNSGKAYVGFPFQDHAKWFEGVLNKAGIECSYTAKSMGIGSKSATGEVTDALTLDTASVKFPSEALLQAIAAVEAEVLARNNTSNADGNNADGPN